MSDEIEFGFTIMSIGMITVFTILGLVVLGGKIMILVIDNYSTEVKQSSPSEITHQEISNIKISILSTVVNAITKGKGKITKIEKR